MTSKYYVTVSYSHPKYRAALMKKFPSLACANDTDNEGSVASAATTVSENKASDA
jgi:hypothetical protein